MAHHIRPPSNQADAHHDRQAELEKLMAQATSRYSVRDYDAAAEFYSQATELQAELNGEMASQNANLLYAYGRCLYHTAVRNSDVLGSKVAGEKRSGGTPKPSGNETTRATDELTSENMRGAEEGSAQVPASQEAIAQPADVPDQNGKPYFQFTGDDNFDGTDDEARAEQPDGEDGEEVEEEDDFANAFEVLDLARVLLLKRIEEEQGKEQSQGRPEETNSCKTIRQLKERLADTYDLQAEISLEGERFPNAVDDLRAALDLKLELFPEESSLIAEAHYKLSLALEFSSVTQQKTEDGTAETRQEAHIDEAMRAESATEMEAAIASCKLRISKEQANLYTIGATNGGTNRSLRKGIVTQQDINDVKDMVADMEQRVSLLSLPRSAKIHSSDMREQLIELRQSPVSINGALASGNADRAEQLGGILGSILGESPAAQREKLDEASIGAKDLSNLVKRKKLTPSVVPELTDEDNLKSNGKRKVEFVEVVVEVGTGKKARLSDGDEE
ncbi:MAG: hypothetical protein Q9196_001254 [Gyalolechia fulgens]